MTDEIKATVVRFPERKAGGLLAKMEQQSNQNGASNARLALSTRNIPIPTIVALTAWPTSRKTMGTAVNGLLIVSNLRE